MLLPGPEQGRELGLLNKKKKKPGVRQQRWPRFPENGNNLRLQAVRPFSTPPGCLGPKPWSTALFIGSEGPGVIVGQRLGMLAAFCREQGPRRG